MGSAFEFTIVSDEETASGHLNAAIEEVQRIEALLTEFNANSQTSLINQNAGIKPVHVNPEVFRLIERSVNVSRLSQGAFDITASLLKKLYDFKKKEQGMPSQEVIDQALRKVGAEKIRLRKPNSVLLKVPGMHIGFGGIGKGYAADAVKELMIANGVHAGVINASGDLTAWGNREDGTQWKVGIADPNERNQILMWVPISNGAVATSGDYEQYFEWKGVRWTHNINPKTGWPVTGMKSVTIISPSAELSDALATAVFVMGAEVGLHFIEQLPNTHAIMINDNNKVFSTKNINVILSDQKSNA